MIAELLIQPTDEDWRLAREVYALFAAKPGARHIATVSSLAHLSGVLRRHRVSSVLEFGAGIGTITYLLLKRLPQSAKIVSIERNEWCRGQFEQNIPAAIRSRVELVHDVSPSSISQSFDLIIIDGSAKTAADFVHEGSVCFVEGNRTDTRNAVAAAIERRGFQCAFAHYPARGFRIRWRVSRFGFNLPRLRRAKGVWIGAVSANRQSVRAG